MEDKTSINPKEIKILEKIGQSGEGTIYKDLYRNKEVAVKVILKFNRGFKNEISFLM